MPIEYVPVLDENGDDIGGYTESVPETYVKEEPDCYSCNDSGCPACCGCGGDDCQACARAAVEQTTHTDPWDGTTGAWGGYSTESPF